MKVALMGSIVRCLYRDYDLLTHFTPPRPDMLVIMPPLIIKESQIDYFVDSINNMLDMGLSKLFRKFLIGNVKDII